MDPSTPDMEMPEYRGPVKKMIFEIITPLNIALSAIFFVLVFKIVKRFTAMPVDTDLENMPRLRKDMTPAELRQYDGTGPDGRVLVAVNGWIFDVTRGSRFYGPGGPYAAFGGKDASRGLATFSVTSSDREYDDLSDLNSIEMESVREWEAQFREKYELVGRLLKPGEEPTTYSDDETEETDASNNTITPEERKNQ